MLADDVFEVPFCLFDGMCKVVCTYASPQVLRFKITSKQKELHLQKLLLLKTRQPFKILSANFTMESDDIGRRLNWLFKSINDYLKQRRNEIL
jgi:Golgi nucleoside diphosphatase